MSDKRKKKSLKTPLQTISETELLLINLLRKKLQVTLSLTQALINAYMALFSCGIIIFYKKKNSDLAINILPICFICLCLATQIHQRSKRKKQIALAFHPVLFPNDKLNKHLELTQQEIRYVCHHENRLNYTKDQMENLITALKEKKGAGRYNLYKAVTFASHIILFFGYFNEASNKITKLTGNIYLKGRNDKFHTLCYSLQKLQDNLQLTFTTHHEQWDVFCKQAKIAHEHTIKTSYFTDPFDWVSENKNIFRIAFNERIDFIKSMPRNIYNEIDPNFSQYAQALQKQKNEFFEEFIDLSFSKIYPLLLKFHRSLGMFRNSLLSVRNNISDIDSTGIFLNMIFRTSDWLLYVPLATIIMKICLSVLRKVHITIALRPCASKVLLKGPMIQLQGTYSQLSTDLLQLKHMGAYSNKQRLNLSTHDQSELIILTPETTFSNIASLFWSYRHLNRKFFITYFESNNRRIKNKLKKYINDIVDQIKVADESNPSIRLTPHFEPNIEKNTITCYLNLSQYPYSAAKQIWQTISESMLPKYPAFKEFDCSFPVISWQITDPKLKKLSQYLKTTPSCSGSLKSEYSGSYQDFFYPPQRAVARKKKIKKRKSGPNKKLIPDGNYFKKTRTPMRKTFKNNGTITISLERLDQSQITHFIIDQTFLQRFLLQSVLQNMSESRFLTMITNMLFYPPLARVRGSGVQTVMSTERHHGHRLLNNTHDQAIKCKLPGGDRLMFKKIKRNTYELFSFWNKAHARINRHRGRSENGKTSNSNKNYRA